MDEQELEEGVRWLFGCTWFSLFLGQFGGSGVPEPGECSSHTTHRWLGSGPVEAFTADRIV